MTRAARKARERRHQLRRSHARNERQKTEAQTMAERFDEQRAYWARMAEQAGVADASGVTAAGPQYALEGRVLNPGDPGWTPSDKFLASEAGQGWYCGVDGQWHNDEHEQEGVA